MKGSWPKVIPIHDEKGIIFIFDNSEDSIRFLDIYFNEKVIVKICKFLWFGDAASKIIVPEHLSRNNLFGIDLWKSVFSNNAIFLILQPVNQCHSPKSLEALTISSKQLRFLAESSRWRGSWPGFTSCALQDFSLSCPAWHPCLFHLLSGSSSSCLGFHRATFHFCGHMLWSLVFCCEVSKENVCPIMRELLIFHLEVTRTVNDSPYQTSVMAVGINLRVTQGPEPKCFHCRGLLTNCRHTWSYWPESASTLSFNMLTVL